MDKELNSIFESLDKEIFTDELKTTISGVIAEAVDKKVAERVDLELQQMDETHAEQTKTILERMESTFNDYRKSVDEDHCKKMLQVKTTLEESYGKKLLMVKNLYDNAIQKEAVQHRDTLVESINTYLDDYLEKAIPQKIVEEAAKNTYVQKQLDEARKVLGIDKKYISESLKQGIVEGKSQYEALAQKNLELERQKLFAESKALIVEKTANLPIEQAKFVKAQLEGKSPDYIERNISYVLEMYARKEKTEKSTLLSEHKNVIVDRAQLVADETRKQNEIQTESYTDPVMAMYSEGLKFRK